MDHRLPDGVYPFASARMRLSEMAMMEAPPELEAILRQAARESGVEIIRDLPVELRCKSEAYPDATFMVFWPSGDERLHVLAPKAAVTGRA